MAGYFRRALAFLAAAGVVNGTTNECLELAGWRCQESATFLSFVGCSLKDDDLEDLATCFDRVGRGTIDALYMTGNSLLTRLPGEIFDGFGNLRDLYLDGIGLTQLDVGSFSGLGSLSWLRLDQNNLTALQPGMFGDLEDLEILTLDHNKIESIPEGLFDGRHRLEQLDLSSNRLTSLPPTLFGTSSGLVSLKSLFLNMNEISELPRELFGGVRAISTLNLSFNTISVLPLGLFDGLANLQILTLDYNSISTLPKGIFDGLRDLEIIYLHHNALETVEATVLQDLENLSSLNLKGNDELQCLPSMTGTSLIRRTLVVPNDVGDTCACPAEGVDESCTSGCQAGPHGYLCTANTPAPARTRAPTRTPAPALTEKVSNVGVIGEIESKNGAGTRSSLSGTNRLVYATTALLTTFIAVKA